MLNNPDRKQIAKSGNEIFMYGEENRNRAKNIMQRINFDQKIQIKPSEEVFKRIDLMIADKEKFPSMKSIGEELGYKATKKGQGGNLRLESQLMQEYQKSRGRNLINEMRFKEYKLTKDSPWVKKVIATRKELGSTRATAKKLKVDRKTIRNITEQFAPNMFGNVNLRKSDKWNYKAIRAKREAELAKRLGGKNNPAFLQYMDLWEDIVDANEDILRMSDDAIFNNPRIKMAMNVDVTGLTIDEPLNFDKYKNLSKKEFAQKVRDMAKTNQFFQAEHSIPIASEKIAAAYPNNLQVAQGKIGSQLEAMKTYIRNNPNGKHIPQINEFLNEFDIQIREGGKTYGWTNPKNKSGLNVYNTQSRTSDIVESAFDKNASNTIFNKNLKNINVGGSGTVLGSNFANINRELLDFRKLPDDVSNLYRAASATVAKSPATLNALRKAKAAAKFTGLGLAGEAAFTAPFALSSYAAGKSGKRILGDATYGLFGQTENEELRKATGELGFATQTLDDLSTLLPAIEAKYNTFNDQNDPRGEKRNQFKNLYEANVKKYGDNYSLFTNDQGEFNTDLYKQAVNNYKAGVMQIQKFDNIAKQQRADMRTGLEVPDIDLNLFSTPIANTPAYDFAGGGIAKMGGVSSGPAPKSGPTPQGLDFLMKRGR
jgi:hypothetical protein